MRRDDALEQEMEREMQFHLDMATKRTVERGMTPDAARRQARRAFGSSGVVVESARDAHRARTVENIVADVRFAFRGLRRSPTFALAAGLTMMLGIAASTAIFSVVDAVLLRPLPIPRPGDFTYIGWVWQKGDEFPALTAFQYEFVRENHRSFEALTTYRTDEASLGAGESPAMVRGLRVSDGFFRTVGFAPRLGRAFDAEELRAGGPAVVILGDAIWRTRFGADDKVVGRQVLLNGESRTVLGVMPPEFHFPPAVDHDGYLVPLPLQAADPGDEGHNTEAIGRLRDDASDDERAADLQHLTETFRTAYPTLAAASESFKLFTHRDVQVGGVRRTIWLLFAAVSLLLVIACANTATLMLVRSSARQREIAVRASIGAAPGRIVQQLLTEGLVLSALSAIAGVFLSILALRGFLALAPTALPQGMLPGIDARVLAFAIATSAAAGIVFGLAAAVPAFRLQLTSGIIGGARTTSGLTRTRELLVFLETASAVVLLAGATVFIASFARLTSVDPGFDADRVHAVRLGRMPPAYDAARRDQLVDRLLDRVRGVPGVEYAAAAPNLPLERGRNFPVDTREHPELAIGAVELRFVSPDYVKTLGIPLAAGRDFGDGDTEGSEPVAIVNEALARRFWPDSSAIGRTVQIGHYNDRWLRPGLEKQTRVIGVAADIREVALDRVPRPTILLPRAQSSDGTPVILVRGTSKNLASILRGEVTMEEPQLVPAVEPLTAVVSRSVSGPRFRTMLIGVFAGSALLLAGIGIYGVIAAVVQQRTKEIGIRLALGARRSTIAANVVRRALTSVAAGCLAGLLVFWAIRRVLTAMLYETSTGDPRLLVVAVAVLALVAAVAAMVPARRAIRVDPATTLRVD